MRIKTAHSVGTIFCALLILLITVASLDLKASADASDQNADGTLSIICSIDDKAYSGVGWRVYRVGERDEYGNLSLTGSFADYDIPFADIDESNIGEVSSTLANYVQTDSIQPDYSGETADNGEYTVSGISKGIYLSCGDSFTDEAAGKIYHPIPALIEVSREYGSEAMDITAYAKFTSEDNPHTSYSIVKIWEGDSDGKSRPQSITVEIYADGELYDTVTLSEDEQWTYSWESDKKVEWSVKEIDVPESYTVAYTNSGAEYTIKNKYTGTGTSSTSSSETSSSDSATSSQTTSSTASPPDTKIPQTGQLWWPVPVLSAAGVLLIAIGWRIHSKKESDE